jgi:acyl-CoA reductase-like NAD-dependent aldehyde dehydrogenase
MVGVNEGVISTEVAPFGGIKESGIGESSTCRSSGGLRVQLYFGDWPCIALAAM